MNKDTFEGGMRKAAGSVESFGGKVANDPNMQASGIADKAAGGVQQAFGQVKDAVSDAASKVGDAVAGGDYDSLRADISKLTQTVASLVQNQASTIGGQVKSAVGATSDNVSQVASAAQDKIMSMEADLEERVKANPLAAVAIALATGFFLGKMTS